MKNILYLSFYFEPDLCAGSFRNSPLVRELSKQTLDLANIDLITTLPNRYNSFTADAQAFEVMNNVNIHRLAIPVHKSGMKDQIFSFYTYFRGVKRSVQGKKYDLVVASSSRLFTAYLGYQIASEQKIPLYLDIRDIFYDTLEDVLKGNLKKQLVLPVIKYIEKKTFSYASHINLISGGFREYFKKYTGKSFSFFPNGIDDIFLQNSVLEITKKQNRDIKQIVYAGNIGEGQGLEKIIPKICAYLTNTHKFIVIGDGGAKGKLLEEIKHQNIQNIEFVPPVKRDELINFYNSADYLFVHLNDFKAFEKVLPSKLFELVTFPKPIIAGVAGFAAEFVRENIDNSLLFEPCDIDSFKQVFDNYTYVEYPRTDFINKFKRDIVNTNMAKSMISLL